MLNRPTLAELDAQTQADIGTRIAGATPGLRRSLLGAIGKALSGALSALYGFLSSLGVQSVPYTATGLNLERWASIWGLGRKQPSAATGTATATGANGTVIVAGTRVQSATGEAYTVGSTATVGAGVSGVATLTLTAVNAGAAGNQAAGAQLGWVNPPAGMAATVVVDASGLSGGADLESDDGLRARMLQRIQTPGHGGNVDDYLGWALSLPQISRAWVSPLYSGAGTVRVWVANDAYTGANLASAGDVSAVQAYLNNVRPVTATVTAAAPTATAVNYTLAISPDSPANRAAVQAALAELYFREAVPEGGLSLNRMIVVIGGAGIDDFTMSAPAAAPTASAGNILTLGSISWA